MFRLLIDHDFNHKILRGLVQRIPNLDFVTADQIEKRAESDENHLIWALRNERVIISHDVNTFTDASIKRLNNGEEIYYSVFLHLFNTFCFIFSRFSL